jgi:hypothetical protein
MKVTVPLLFVANIDDRIFPFPANLELFSALASADRRMHVFPGDHGSLPPDEAALMAQFLADRLVQPSERLVTSPEAQGPGA